MVPYEAIDRDEKLTHSDELTRHTRELCVVPTHAPHSLVPGPEFVNRVDCECTHRMRRGVVPVPTQLKGQLTYYVSLFMAHECRWSDSLTGMSKVCDV